MKIEINAEKNAPEAGTYEAPVTDLSSGTERPIEPTKGMNFFQKLGYYATYYLPKYIAVAVILGLSVSFLLLFLFNKKPAINLLMINHHNGYIEDLPETFRGYLDANGYSKKAKININCAINMDLENFAFYGEREAFDTLIATRDYTLFFSDEAVFTACAKAGYFRDLSVYLSKEELDAFENDIVMGKDEYTREAYPCGLILTRDTCPWLTLTDYETCYFGVLYSDPSDEEVTRQVEYLLNYRP